MKKVLLILIDGLAARFLEPLLQQGEYPNLQQLREAGQWRESCSIFPSITHAALSSLVTGVYPRQHGVVASHWYLQEEERLAYYGVDPLVIWTEGMGDFYDDYLRLLNHRRLRAETIFQRVERAGLHAASINHLIFRGDQEHKVNRPFLLDLMPDMSEDEELTVMGPKTLFVGEFVRSAPNCDLDDFSFSGGPQNWFGFIDSSTSEILLQLAEKEALPDFTLAYFPKNDFQGHEQGPEAAHQALDDLDEMLGKLFMLHGGLDSMLSEFAVIVTGDHAHSDVKEDKEEAGIELDQILDQYQFAEPGKPWQEGDEIMACTNLRAAHLYFRHPDSAPIRQVVEELRQTAAIDQVICRAERFESEKEGYLVFQGDDELRFWPGEKAEDIYGNSWDWEGDLAVVDGRVEDGRLHFGDYPNAFERLAGALDSEDGGQIWLTARPGHEPTLPGVRVHNGGGSHASLHRDDSISPLIAAGLPEEASLPDHPRLIDIAPLCLSLLGVD